MNYFAEKTAAERYAKGRPYYHPVVMERIRSYLHLDSPVGRVLDVACGTGLSCMALKALAREIVGTDISPEMLALAPLDPVIRYLVAPAEELPFPDKYFDLITVSSAFHWFERERFLKEADRLLVEKRWLVVYENNFQGGKMNGCPEFSQWMPQYWHRYPAPPRHSDPLTEQQAAAAGFQIKKVERYTNDVDLSMLELIDYLTTQTNIIAAVEQGEESIESAREWLRNKITPFYDGREKAIFEFAGDIMYLQKQAEA